MGGVGTNRKDAKHFLKSLPLFFPFSISAPRIAAHLITPCAAVAFESTPSDSRTEQNAAHLGAIS
jgi:hypothetical protein